MINEDYNNFKFTVTINDYDDNLVDIYWGTDKKETEIIVPFDRVDELASRIYEFLEEYEEYGYTDTEICAFCGNYYCTCCGCDCIMEYVD